MKTTTTTIRPDTIDRLIRARLAHVGSRTHGFADPLDAWIVGELHYLTACGLSSRDAKQAMGAVLRGEMTTRRTHRDRFDVRAWRAERAKVRAHVAAKRAGRAGR